MLLSYKECLKKYGNDYQIKQAVLSEKIFRLESGIYSNKQGVSELAIIMKKYSNVIITGESAFYYHGLTNVIPEKYFVASKLKAARLKDSRVVQIYTRDDLLILGAIEMEVDGVNVKIYDRERMLIELLRNKNSIPFDLYKEIIGNYRRIIYDLEVWRIQEYAEIFPKSKMIRKALEEEIL